MSQLPFNSKFNSKYFYHITQHDKFRSKVFNECVGIQAFKKPKYDIIAQYNPDETRVKSN